MILPLARVFDSARDRFATNAGILEFPFTLVVHTAETDKSPWNGLQSAVVFYGSGSLKYEPAQPGRAKFFTSSDQLQSVGSFAAVLILGSMNFDPNRQIFPTSAADTWQCVVTPPTSAAWNPGRNAGRPFSRSMPPSLTVTSSSGKVTVVELTDNHGILSGSGEAPFSTASAIYTITFAEGFIGVG